MPYLTETDFNAPSGELNRALTKILLNDGVLILPMFREVIAKYIHDQKPRYATYNDVVGALECAKLEFFRRRGYSEALNKALENLKTTFYNETVAPYEDGKIKEHGDIYAVNRA